MTPMVQASIGRILRIEVPIVVLLGEKSMRLSEVLSLQPGMILELPKRADSELDLHVNNMHIGTGVAVKVGENFGIRLTYIGDLQTRIAAMGPEQHPATESGADADPVAAVAGAPTT